MRKKQTEEHNDRPASLPPAPVPKVADGDLFTRDGHPGVWEVVGRDGIGGPGALLLATPEGGSWWTSADQLTPDRGVHRVEAVPVEAAPERLPAPDATALSADCAAIDAAANSAKDGIERLYDFCTHDDRAGARYQEACAGWAKLAALAERFLRERDAAILALEAPRSRTLDTACTVSRELAELLVGVTYIRENGVDVPPEVLARADRAAALFEALRDGRPTLAEPRSVAGVKLTPDAIATLEAVDGALRGGLSWESLVTECRRTIRAGGAP